MFSELADFVEENALTCTNKKLFGVECMGCGFQRSFILLCRGDIIGSIKMYPALLPIILLIVFTLIHIIFKIKNGHKVILGLFILSTGIMVTHYIVRQIEIFSHG